MNWYLGGDTLNPAPLIATHWWPNMEGPKKALQITIACYIRKLDKEAKCHSEWK